MASSATHFQPLSWCSEHRVSPPAAAPHTLFPRTLGRQPLGTGRQTLWSGAGGGLGGLPVARGAVVSSEASALAAWLRRLGAEAHVSAPGPAFLRLPRGGPGSSDTPAPKAWVLSWTCSCGVCRRRSPGSVLVLACQPREPVWEMVLVPGGVGPSGRGGGVGCPV